MNHPHYLERGQALKIVHINTYDIIGGAARAAYRLHIGLDRLGQDSTMFVANRKSEDPKVVTFRPPMKAFNRLHRFFRRKKIEGDFQRYAASCPSGYDPFTDDRSEHGNDVLGQLPSCDIINLHWVAGFVDYRAFFSGILKNIPIVWTLHDMNAFTGGCHYDYSCGKFIRSCGGCPQLGSDIEDDLSRKVWKRKKVAFDQLGAERLHIIAPSRWLAKEAKQSSLLGRFPVSVIPYGLDQEVFAPRDAKGFREALGIPADAQVVLFVADWVQNKRKGFSILTEAFSGLNDVDNLLLFSVGSGQIELGTNKSYVHLEYIDVDRILSIAYSAADVFVIPSLQDNLPNTVLEAIACGTPVVGFDVSGIPDLVRPGITGYLAPVQDVSALRNAIVDLLGDPDTLAEMSANCRRVAKKEYDLNLQAKRYAELYEKILTGQ